MAAYLFANINIFDQKTYDNFNSQVQPTIEKFGGRFLVRAGKHETLEGTWMPTRIVLIEFPDMAALKSWYQSSDYAPLIQLRHASAYCDVVTLQGV
ncbi:MAG: DUF1330 domain-containing protein [Terracidiphilus sp.]